EYYLRQQLKMIRKELGEDEDGSAEIKEWREKIDAAELPEHVLEVANKELDRLERINPASAEYSVVTTYLDWLVTLPWNKLTEDHLDLKEARRILDEDHYGLDDIKDRILEVLAVRKLKPDAHGPILCFVGPPGVGKTSLGKSIARAMGRNFVRMSLGGVRDEAEIRGHRRTYVGALPGRILQQIRKAGSSNPVFMLDEVDKMASDFRGDPASAMLEVLDPAQNHSFTDHYIELEYDLSAVFFICTANYLEAIPPPLRDRMEVIRLPGYIAREKVEIARNYLAPRQIEANGLTKKQIRFTRRAFDDIVTFYTYEAGVRNLERNIGTICRKVARKLAEDGLEGQVIIKHGNLRDYLGPEKITPSWVRRRPMVGVAIGLAYTPVGGTVLEIETVMMPGKGTVRVTGQLGDVMKESASIAHSWSRANARRLRISPDRFTKRDLHLHVPAGATPKDGPSAGVTMCTSIVSRLSGRKVRSDVAMTGEITLCGNVLPIGGLREKVVAANRAKIKHVILPWENRKDLEKIPEEVREQIEFHPVKHIDEVLELALFPDANEKRRERPAKRERAVPEPAAAAG
ncbi:MAG TPA: endopeptidase La, partial [Bacteroidetes bacterium]|nr:endopeptidase La [Bacteroidota bacterium]